MCNLNAAVESSNVKLDPRSNINNIQAASFNNIGSPNQVNNTFTVDDEEDETKNKFRNIARNLGLSGTIYTAGSINGQDTSKGQNTNLSGGTLNVDAIKTVGDNFDAKMQQQAVQKEEPKKKISGYKKMFKKAAKKYMSVSYKGAMAFTGITAQGVSGDASPASLAAAGVAGCARRAGCQRQHDSGGKHDGQDAFHNVYSPFIFFADRCVLYG